MQLNRRAFIGALAASMTCPAVGFAVAGEVEDIDLSGMTIEDLVALKARVEAEIVARVGGDLSAIYTGDYLVGTHIAAGTYKIVGTSPNNSTWVCVYSSATARDDWDDDFSTYLDDGEIAQVTLVDGGYLEISGMATIVPYKPAWGL